MGRQVISDESVEHGVIFAKPKNNNEDFDMEDFSQNKEQNYILNFFKNENPKRNKFLDIGANDGKTFSNTHALALLGWSGVCVEPTNSAFLKLQKLYINNKNIKCVNAGISNITEVAEIFESLDWNNSKAPVGILSTLNENNKDRFNGMNWRTSQVILYKFNDMQKFYNLENESYDFINVDVEGHELIVLSEIDDLLKKCRLICIEKTDNEINNEKILNRLNGYGFNIVSITTDNYILSK
jgi:FkbM family methyltransferase